MSSISQRLSKWFSQPQDIMGLATLAGSTGAGIYQYITGHSAIPLSGLIGADIAGLVAITVPAGSFWATDIEAVITNLFTFYASRNAAAAQALLTSLSKLLSDVAGKLTPTIGS